MNIRNIIVFFFPILLLCLSCASARSLMRNCQASQPGVCYQAAATIESNRKNHLGKMHAFEFYRKACEGGHLEGCHRFGEYECYFYGITEKNADLMTKICSEGGASVCNSLGSHFLRKGDLHRSIPYFSKSCDLGNQSACESQKNTIRERDAVKARALADREERERIAAEKARKIELIKIRLRKVADEEIAEGRCNEKNYDVMDDALSRTYAIYGHLDGPNGLWQRVGHKVFAATPDGSVHVIGSLFPGEYHFFTMGYFPIAMNALDSAGYSINRRSDFEVLLPLNDRDSRVHNASGQSYHVVVKGRGCAILVVFRRIR